MPNGGKPVPIPFELTLARRVIHEVHKHFQLPQPDEEMLEIEVMRAIRLIMLEAKQHRWMCTFPEHDGVPDQVVMITN